MDIEFRSVSGSRVGFIIGSDVKDTNGNKVGWIVGDDIKDSNGGRIGFLIGSDFKDANGNRVGMIIGNDIKDTYGNRVGFAMGSASEIEKAAAGLLLFNLKPEAAASNSKSPSTSNSGNDSPQYKKNANSDGYPKSNAGSVSSLASELSKGLDDEALNGWLQTLSYENQKKTEESTKKYFEEQLQIINKINEEKRIKRHKELLPRRIIAAVLFLIPIVMGLFYVLVEGDFQEIFNLCFTYIIFGLPAFIYIRFIGGTVLNWIFLSVGVIICLTASLIFLDEPFIVVMCVSYILSLIISMITNWHNSDIRARLRHRNY
jgi:cation transport ATPase